MATQDDKKAMWVGWTHDAMARYVIPDDIKSDEELIDDMVNTSVDYADAMLEEFEDRFEGSRGTGRRRKKKREPEPDDDDDDDDDDPED